MSKSVVLMSNCSRRRLMKLFLEWSEMYYTINCSETSSGITLTCNELVHRGLGKVSLPTLRLVCIASFSSAFSSNGGAWSVALDACDLLVRHRITLGDFGDLPTDTALRMAVDEFEHLCSDSSVTDTPKAVK